MLVMCFSAAAFAAAVYSEGDFHYQLEDDAITITEYFGSDSEAAVPAMIAGYPVSKIAKGAFVGTTVKTLHLPDTIMTIENQAIDASVSVVYANKEGEKGPTGTDDIENGADASDVGKDNTGAGDTGNTAGGKDGHTNISGTDNRIGGSANQKAEENGLPGQDIDEADVELFGSTGPQGTQKPEAEEPDEPEEPEKPEKPEEPGEKRKGIPKADNTRISVDDQKRLNSMDEEEKDTVSDDTSEYKMEDQADGRSKIRRIVLISSVVIIVSVGVLLYSRRKRKARK